MPLNTLYLLDLDHTLIYGSYAPSETADLLFEYSQYLKVYERPYARDLVDLLKNSGDIIVYTTAKHDYAEKICELLSIQQKELLSREDCISNGDNFKKSIKKEWAAMYSKIVILDDSPQVWDTLDYRVEWFIPKEFRGDKEDSGLLPVIAGVRQILSAIT